MNRKVSPNSDVAVYLRLCCSLFLLVVTCISAHVCNLLHNLALSSPMTKIIYQTFPGAASVIQKVGEERRKAVGMEHVPKIQKQTERNHLLFHC